MQTYKTPFFCLLAALALIIVFCHLCRTKPPTLPPFDQIQHVKDSLLIVEQNNIIVQAQAKIDSLDKVKQKTVTIIKEVPKIIKEYQFHETQSAMFSIFDTVELLRRENDTLFCLTETQAKQAVTTDTLLKLHIIALSASDSIISEKDIQLTAKDSIIDANERISERWHNAYLNASKRKRLWRGIAGISVLINVVQGLGRR